MNMAPIFPNTNALTQEVYLWKKFYGPLDAIFYNFGLWITTTQQKCYWWMGWSNLLNNRSLTHEFWECFCKFYVFGDPQVDSIKDTKQCLTKFI